MLVTVPFVLLLLDFWPLDRMRTSTILWLAMEKLPFLALSLASSVTTFLFQRGAGAASSLETLPLEFRISNALVSYVRYAAKAFWPVDLAAFYPTPSQWSDLWVAGAILILAGVTALTVWRRRLAAYLPVGWFWYVGTLVPVIGIVQVGQQAMTDRYTYIPLIGLFIMIVWSAAEIPARWPAARPCVTACGAAAIGACAVLTWSQIAYWRNSASLFAHALAVTRDNAVAENNLGVCFLEAGNVAAAEVHFAEAVRLAEAACRLNGGKEPRYFGTLDAAYAEVGRFDDAISTATKARELALAAGQKEIARSAEARLVFYRARKPYHSPDSPGISP